MVTPPKKRLLSVFRLDFLTRLLFVAFVLLGLRLSYLQIVKGENFRKRVSSQSTRRLWLPASRGLIKDRNGELLAYNRPERNLTYEASRYNKHAQSNAVTRLSSLLLSPPNTLSANLQPKKRLPDGTAILARDLSEDLFVRVAERSDEIPGLKLDYNSARRYPLGATTGHLTGYTGIIHEDDPRLEDRTRYHINDIVGREGLEYSCDATLHGKNGRRMVEVDRVGRYSGILIEEEAEAGFDITTTLDIRLQKAAEAALVGKVGAAVVIDCRNGEVLALVSSPGYDPNLFIGGISSSNYALLRDNPDHPLLNRATQGLYPLGSVFKLVTSLAGLEKGVFTPKTVYYDTGVFKIGDREVKNFHKKAYGNVTLKDALKHSINSFFCYYANPIGAENLANCARSLGLGNRTGLELPSEAYGQIPTPTWKKNIQKESWYPGDTVNLSIGHGFILVTPVQVARLAAAIANGGDVLPLTVIKSISKNGRETAYKKDLSGGFHTEFKPESLRAVREGMYAVVNEIGGSGSRVKNKVKNLVVAGKTGSAMLGKHTYAWFAAFAPYENPEIAVAVVIENATTGGTDAAPVAGDIFRVYEKIRQTKKDKDN